MKRKKRIDRIGEIVAPLPRFWGALGILPAFLLMEGLLLKSIFTFCFALLAIASGKRIQFLYFVILLFSVTFFHLLSPLGRVLLELGPFIITEGALHSGMERGVGLIGMVFLSVASVRPELELPGHFGGLLGRTFYHFNRIIEGKSRIQYKNFLESLDEFLMERFNPEEENFPCLVIKKDSETPIPRTVSKIAGVGWVITVNCIAWGLLFLL